MPPLRIACVSVKVIGDLTHYGVDGPIARTEDSVGDLGKLPDHVCAFFVGRIHPVCLPNHQRYGADLAVGDPSVLVLVVPGRQAGGVAKLAPSPLGPFVAGRHAVIPVNRDPRPP